MADEIPKYRYGNIARLFATMSMNKTPNYADTADKIIGELSNEELMDLFYGTKQEIAMVIRKHNLSFGFMDLIGILIDGEPTSAKILTTTAQDIPPRNKMH